MMIPMQVYPRLWSLPVWSWIFYDFANTIFSYAVITRYFNDWIINQQGHPDWMVGAMGFGVSLVLVLALPFWGALADEYGRRKPFLAVFTGLCVLATAGLGLTHAGLGWILALGAIAVLSYNSALAHYDPLLARLAPPERRGRISGLGVALGYVGVMLSLLVFSRLVPEGHNQAAFVPTAIMFAVFALPCLLWVPDVVREKVGPRRPLGQIARAALEDVRGAVSQARRLGYGRFLLARFLYVDALATVIAFMTVYAKRIGDLGEGQVTQLLAASIVFAVLGAVVAGRLAERWGPRRVLLVVIAAGSLTLMLGAATGSAALLWVLAPMVGITLGGINASDRILLLRLVPESHRGEAFGIYALVGKLSSGLGPLVLWGGTIWLLHSQLELLGLAGASRAALGVLALAAAAGWLVLRGVDETPYDQRPRPGFIPGQMPGGSGD